MYGRKKFDIIRINAIEKETLQIFSISFGKSSPIYGNQFVLLLYLNLKVIHYGKKCFNFILSIIIQKYLKLMFNVVLLWGFNE